MNETQVKKLENFDIVIKQIVVIIVDLKKRTNQS